MLELDSITVTGRKRALDTYLFLFGSDRKDVDNRIRNVTDGVKELTGVSLLVYYNEITVNSRRWTMQFKYLDFYVCDGV